MYPLSILYAEDDDILRKQYLKYLKEVFNNVYEAKNGEEAFNLYTTNKPHIILLDIDMPKLNGLLVAKRIREKDSNTKIIILTAFSDKEKLFQAIPLNLVNYLTKPIKINKLEKTLHTTANKIMEEQSLCSTKEFEINNNFIYNPDTKVLYDNSIEIRLTKNEIKLLELFIKQPNLIIPTADIFNYLWDDFNYSMTRLRSLINRLNQKLSHKIIESEYGIGYKLSK